MKKIDQLFNSVKEYGPVCLGLDTHLSYLPEEFVAKFTSKGEAIFEFNKAIIDATLEDVACYKPQIAYYEALGIEGLIAYSKTLRYIEDKGKISIADIKRGDIADSAKQYAAGHLEGDMKADFITLAPYMGLDSIQPYLPYSEDHGFFVLVKTSNSGAMDFQLKAMEGGERLYEVVGKEVERLAVETIGENGYGAMGAVIGCTNMIEAEKMRSLFPHTFFLVPGYGAQGGTAKDVAPLFKDKNGLVVNASRSIMLNYRKFDDGNRRFEYYAHLAAKEMKEALLGEC